MAKKTNQTEVNPTESTEAVDTSTGEVTSHNEDFGYESSPEEIPMADFDTEGEYKPIPLLPKGIFEANVTKVAYNPEAQTIDWTVTFEGNGDVFMLDNETPVDGATLQIRNFLPKVGDENERTKSGRMTKRQAKINMLKNFADDMKIKMGSPQQILEALANQEWLGLRVKTTVGFRTWEGRTFNNLEKMAAV